MKAAKGALMAGTVGSYRMRFDLMGSTPAFPRCSRNQWPSRRFYQHRHSIARWATHPQRGSHLLDPNHHLYVSSVFI